MAEKQKQVYNIFTEKNPNPNSLKFVVNEKLLLERGSVDYADPASAQESPLAEDLFRFSFVTRVFITENFVTVTKKEDIEWEDVAPMIKALIKGYLEEERPVFREKVQIEEISPDDPEIVQKIKVLLDEYIRPAVAMDGGAIKYKNWDEQNGIVTVELHGACSGCPSSTMTLKAGIEQLFKKMIPEVKEVQAEAC